MTRIDRNLPEPSLPEHALICAAAPSPRLSAGFRQRVLSECEANVRMARRGFRLKVTASLAAACCLSLLVWQGLPGMPDDARSDRPNLAQEPQQQPPEPNFYYRQDSGSPAGAGREGLAIDKATPPQTELQQMDQLMEGLQQRTQQIFDSSMLPGL